MNVDVEGLRSTIRDLRQQVARQQIVGLDEDIDRLERIAADAEHQPRKGADSADGDMNLPPGISVPRPDAVAEYLRAHPDTVDVVREVAAALVDEFKHERSSIELSAEGDDYIDETDLVFNVRVAMYDDSFVDRLHRVEERFDDRLTHTTGSVYVTTDHVPAE